MIDRCDKHDDVIAGISRVEATLVTLVAAVNKMDARLEDGQKRFSAIETRQAVNETLMNIDAPDKDETPDFAIRKGMMTANFNKIDWKRVGGWAAWGFTFLLSAVAYFKGGK